MPVMVAVQGDDGHVVADRHLTARQIEHIALDSASHGGEPPCDVDDVHRGGTSPGGRGLAE